MASTQELLSAINNMQINAQDALPVIPNNGNPGGAYNMPQQAQEAGGEPVSRYQWLEPSPSIGKIREILDAQAVRIQEHAQNLQDLAYQEAAIPKQIQQKYNPMYYNGRLMYEPLNDVELPLGIMHEVPFVQPSRELPANSFPVLPEQLDRVR